MTHTMNIRLKYRSYLSQIQIVAEVYVKKITHLWGNFSCEVQKTVAGKV